MLQSIDGFLDGITMYRLMLYSLTALVIVAVVLSFLRILPFDTISLLFSAVFLIVTTWVNNKIFAKVFKVPTNLESVYITALILTLIITPVGNLRTLPLLFAAAFVSMASKYILVIQRKHIFNPAAFAIAFMAGVFHAGASWWVGTTWMMPFVIALGVLIVRKINRGYMVLSFLLAASAVILVLSFLKGNDLFLVGQRIILDSPIIFFAFVMLTEPLTTPPVTRWQIVYGGLVGFLFLTTPEVALLLGNVFTYIVSPKIRLPFILKEKIQIAPDIYDFIFKPEKKIKFLPGQYLEWTLSHPNPDSRGVRRYFTVASSPTEGDLRIGTKFYPEPSTFKKKLLSMQPGDQITAGQLAGDFVLPEDKTKKLVFLAGGIGVTPFRSMIKYLMDIEEKRNIILLYSSKLAHEFVYKGLFDKADQNIGIKTVYVLTDMMNVPSDWQGRVGYIDDKAIKEEVPDYKERIFYLSGPHLMVDAFVITLKRMGIPGNKIKLDFFPGYA